MSGAVESGAEAPSLRWGEAWPALERHQAQLAETHMRELFAADPDRGERLVADGAGLHLDFSKNRVVDETLILLGQLARERGVEARREAMFAGEHINVSEDRAVLHVALRMPRERSLIVDGVDVVREVHEMLDRMADFAERVRSGAWTGHTGKRIRNVVNVGIGGSDLGPVMAYEALRHFSHRDLTFRFVSNVDGTDFAECDARPRPGGDAVRRLLEDLHHAGDDDQRAHGARVALAGLRRRGGGGRQALRRSLDQRRGGREVRHRHGEHVRVLGLGRRPLLDGLGDRALDHAGDRPGPASARCCRLPRDGRALPRDADRRATCRC